MLLHTSTPPTNSAWMPSFSRTCLKSDRRGSLMNTDWCPGIWRGESRTVRRGVCAALTSSAALRTKTSEPLLRLAFGKPSVELFPDYMGFCLKAQRPESPTSGCDFDWLWLQRGRGYWPKTATWLSWIKASAWHHSEASCSYHAGRDRTATTDLNLWILSLGIHTMKCFI